MWLLVHAGMPRGSIGDTSILPGQCRCSRPSFIIRKIILQSPLPPPPPPIRAKYIYMIWAYHLFLVLIFNARIRNFLAWDRFIFVNAITSPAKYEPLRGVNDENMISDRNFFHIRLFKDMEISHVIKVPKRSWKDKVIKDLLLVIYFWEKVLSIISFDDFVTYVIETYYHLGKAMGFTSNQMHCKNGWILDSWYHERGESQWPLHQIFFSK